jgi:hypothetical protein
MSQTVRFGIVGGYGATGRVVVSELWKSCPGEDRIGGRDPARGEALATTFDGRVSATLLDVLDAPSLDRFCSECSIIVHRAGSPTVRHHAERDGFALSDVATLIPSQHFDLRISVKRRQWLRTLDRPGERGGGEGQQPQDEHHQEVAHG